MSYLGKRTRRQAGFPLYVGRRKSIRTGYGPRYYGRRVPGLAIVPGITRTVGAYRRSAPALNKGNMLEKKYQDVDIDAVTISTGGVFLNTDSFVKIAQGTTKNTRIGNKISVCNWNLHGVVTLPEAATQVGETMRIIVGIDKQANGAVPNVTDVLEVAEYDSFRAMDSVDRFKILKDKWVTLNIAVASATAGSVNRHFKLGFKHLSLPIHYSSTAGAITELRSNSLFVLVIGQIGNCTIDCQSRVKFYDL